MSCVRGYTESYKGNKLKERPFDLIEIFTSWIWGISQRESHRIAFSTICWKGKEINLPIRHHAFKKTLLQSVIEWERGKFDFDHHFAFLTEFLKNDKTFCLVASFSARREGRFQKISKTDLPFRFFFFPSDFVKFIFFGKKKVVCCLLFAVCCLLFVAIYTCPILAYLKKWSIHRAEKDSFS